MTEDTNAIIIFHLLSESTRSFNDPFVTMNRKYKKKAFNTALGVLVYMQIKIYC